MDFIGLLFKNNSRKNGIEWDILKVQMGKYQARFLLSVTSGSVPNDFCMPSKYSASELHSHHLI